MVHPWHRDPRRIAHHLVEPGLHSSCTHRKDPSREVSNLSSEDNDNPSDDRGPYESLDVLQDYFRNLHLNLLSDDGRPADRKNNRVIKRLPGVRGPRTEHHEVAFAFHLLVAGRETNRELTPEEHGPSSCAPPPQRPSVRGAPPPRLMSAPIDLDVGRVQRAGLGVSQPRRSAPSLFALPVAVITG